jgi:hypothetical protein
VTDCKDLIRQITAYAWECQHRRESPEPYYLSEVDLARVRAYCCIYTVEPAVMRFCGVPLLSKPPGIE